MLEYVKDEQNPKKKSIRLTDLAFPFGRPGISSSADTIVSHTSSSSSDSALMNIVFSGVVGC